MELKDAKPGEPWEMVDDGRAIVRLKVSDEIQSVCPDMIPVFVFEEKAFGFLLPETPITALQAIVIE